MNKARFAVSHRQVGDSLAFAMDVDTILSPEEILVPDARTGVSPSEMVDRKLLAALGGVAASGCRRGRYGHGGSGQDGGGRYGA
jgi:hypothetical protein